MQQFCQNKTAADIHKLDICGGIWTEKSTEKIILIFLHSLKRPFHRYNSLLLRISILRTEPVILLALHNTDLAHRVHAAACPITKLGIIGVWFIVCSTGLATERGIQPIKHRCGLLTGDGLVRSECSVIIAGYNTERRCQTDTLILAVGKGRCRSRGGIRLHINNAIVS